MNFSDPQNSGVDDDDVVLTTPDGHALPRILDRAVTMDIVQTYVESERIRSRRAVVWLGTVFLFVVLLVLAIFVFVGVHVMRNSKRVTHNMEKVTSRVDEVSLETAAYASEVIDMTNRLHLVQNVQDAIVNDVKKHEAVRTKKEHVLWRNLTNFSNWVVERDDEGLEYVSGLENRLKELEESAAIRRMELVAVKQEYSSMLLKMTEQTNPVAMSDENKQKKKESTDSIQYEFYGKKNEGVDRNLSSDDTVDSGEMDILDGVIKGGPKGDISIVTFPNGDKYEGEFKNGLFDGWGTFFYHNGDKYEGEFENDEKQGRGSFVYSNGDRYDGEFNNNVRAGRGRLLFKNGDRYVGDFKNDVITGKGTYFYKNKNRYIGDFRNGLKQGNGGFMFANGDRYEGEFRDNKRQGRGTYTFTDGGRYIGEFMDGMRHGDGRYIYPDGKEYIGEFKESKKDGRGVCVYPNGKQLKGIWRNDKLVKRLE